MDTCLDNRIRAMASLCSAMCWKMEFQIGTHTGEEWITSSLFDAEGSKLAMCLTDGQLGEAVSDLFGEVMNFGPDTARDHLRLFYD